MDWPSDGLTIRWIDHQMDWPSDGLTIRWDTYLHLAGNLIAVLSDDTWKISMFFFLVYSNSVDRSSILGLRAKPFSILESSSIPLLKSLRAVSWGFLRPYPSRNAPRGLQIINFLPKKENIIYKMFNFLPRISPEVTFGRSIYQYNPQFHHILNTTLKDTYATNSVKTSIRTHKTVFSTWNPISNCQNYFT